MRSYFSCSPLVRFVLGALRARRRQAGAVYARARRRLRQRRHLRPRERARRAEGGGTGARAPARLLLSPPPSFVSSCRAVLSPL